MRKRLSVEGSNVIRFLREKLGVPSRPDLAADRSVSVYRVGDRVLLCPQLLTKAGFQVSDLPAVFGWPIGRDALADAVRNALAASGQIVATPHRDANIFAPVIAAAGVKSRKAFMAAAILVDVTLETETLRLLPMINHGPTLGFEGAGEDRTREFPADRFDAAAECLLRMLEETKAG